ncbi:MAG TPA: hypothetical protein PKH17_04535 [Candidatus Syntrophosphaera sp.]|jgi:hypothetical protein|nr:MAG: hypothetical protein BWY18_00562 [Candidatus Cloacimonetes bacterium ADurb.Bin211]HOD59992.1 hypothetical protein [Candidatus Syntrophosphaera sp.]HQM79535.1 hypothetical protein [Candidatus Syntrophosphaera sp.]
MFSTINREILLDKIESNRIKVILIKQRVREMSIRKEQLTYINKEKHIKKAFATKQMLFLFMEGK